MKNFFQTNSWEFPGTYSQGFLKSSSGISWNIIRIFQSKFTNQDIGPIVVNNLKTILPLQLFRSIIIWFSGISQEFLKTGSQNCDPTKFYHLGDQFWGISLELPRNQLQEMILEKFLRNSLMKVTKVGEFLTFVSWDCCHQIYSHYYDRLLLTVVNNG